VKFHVLDPNAGEVFAMMQLVVPLPKTAVYLRYFFFYPTAAKGIGGWVGKLEGPSGRVWLSLDDTGTFSPEEVGDFLTPSKNKQGGSYKLPLDKWVCLEWQVQAGTAGKDDGKFRLLADGVDTGLDMSGFVAAPFDTLWTGFNPGSPKIQFDFWMDEYVVSDKPIGCNR
jgi:hypothetical protein